MQLLESTQECEPKYDLWPYKRRNIGGSITKNYRCVELTVIDAHLYKIWKKSIKNCGQQNAHNISTKIWPLTL